MRFTYNSLVTQLFSHSDEQPKQRILAHMADNPLPVYSNISQILLLYLTRYHNKFDSMKSLGVCYCYVKIPHFGYIKHRSEHITCYVKKHMALLGVCSGHPLVHDQPLGTPAFPRVANSLWYSPIKTLHLPGTAYTSTSCSTRYETLSNVKRPSDTYRPRCGVVQSI